MAARAVPIVTVVLIATTLALVGAVTIIVEAPISAGASGGEASAAEVLRVDADIPPAYLRLYQLAARRYGLDWAILAAIGKVECDHGRDPDPSCERQGAVNAAGAGGPMQFVAATWASYGVDGDGDGRNDRWNASDAIFAAARFLRASGAPGDYRRAIYAYNHADWYVKRVEDWASKYRAAPAVSAASSELGSDLQSRTATPVTFIAGTRALLSAADGHTALIPAGVPLTVQAMLVAGNELQRLPYGPGGHPDPREAPEQDCSSTINYVLYRSGVRPIDEIVSHNPLAQDYVRWGQPGPGRWVTVYATTTPTNHVFVIIAGLRLDTSHNGTDTGPNRDEDGPRWRVLDHVPSWAQWSVRHPPGL